MGFMNLAGTVLKSGRTFQTIKGSFMAPTATAAMRAGRGRPTSPAGAAAHRAMNTGYLMGLGGMVGGVAGYASSDANSATNRFGDAMRGAGFGAAIGFAPMAARGAFAAGKTATKTFFKGQSPWKVAGSAAGRMTGAAYGIGKSTAKLGMGALSFALAHPGTLALGAAGAGGLLYANKMIGETSPTLRSGRVNTNYDRQAMTLEEMNRGMSPTGIIGTYPQMQKPMQRALQQSAAGLVQGMHQSRHGG